MNWTPAKRTVPVVIVAAWCAACGGEDKTVVEPSLADKSDVFSEVDFRGHLEYGGEALGEFVNDFQFDAWTFEAAAGAVVTIATTQLGTSSRLDNTLFLYGPADERGQFNDPRIAQDDDSGWGAQAALENVALAGEGRYLVVVGTANGDGRGTYRLVLSCMSESCQPAPAVVDGCPAELLDRSEMCMEAKIYDEGETPSAALESCMDDLYDVFGDQCEYEAVPPEWCGVGVDKFENEVVPACSSATAELFLSPPDLPSDAEIEEMTRQEVRSFLYYEDEGVDCGIRNFVFEGYDRNGSEDLVTSITARSTVEGPVNYCAGYTTYQCWTELEPREGQWVAGDTDCEDVGYYE